jgi:hypothetical protein
MRAATNRSSTVLKKVEEKSCEFASELAWFAASALALFERAIPLAQQYWP